MLLEWSVRRADEPKRRAEEQPLRYRLRCDPFGELLAINYLDQAPRPRSNGT